MDRIGHILCTWQVWKLGSGFPREHSHCQLEAEKLFIKFWIGVHSFRFLFCFLLLTTKYWVNKIYISRTEYVLRSYYYNESSIIFKLALYHYERNLKYACNFLLLLYLFIFFLAQRTNVYNLSRSLATHYGQCRIIVACTQKTMIMMIKTRVSREWNSCLRRPISILLLLCFIHTCCFWRSAFAAGYLYGLAGI